MDQFCGVIPFILCIFPASDICFITHALHKQQTGKQKSDLNSNDKVKDDGQDKGQDENGNISVGDNVIIDSKETTVYSTGRTVAVLGADNLVVVETPSAVLVIDKSRVQEVKRITDELKARGKEELL